MGEITVGKKPLTEFSDIRMYPIIIIMIPRIIIIKFVFSSGRVISFFPLGPVLFVLGFGFTAIVPFVISLS